MVLRYALCAVIAYLLGNFTTGVYVTKWFSNLDIRKVGSGNPGTTNVLRTLGWLPSALTLLGDVLKGLLGGWIGYWLAGEMGARIGGAFAVAGHNWPVFAKFKGGKGFASYLGMILAINWKVALCILAAVVILTVLTDYIVVGTVTSVVSFPIYTAIRSGWLPLVILCVATLAILIKHRENFVRIWNGTEMGLSSAGRGKYKMK